MDKSKLFSAVFIASLLIGIVAIAFVVIGNTLNQASPTPTPTATKSYTFYPTYTQLNPTPTITGSMWLHTSGNQLLLANGTAFQLRGINQNGYEDSVYGDWQNFPEYSPNPTAQHAFFDYWQRIGVNFVRVIYEPYYTNATYFNTLMTEFHHIAQLAAQRSMYVEFVQQDYTLGQTVPFSYYSVHSGGQWISGPTIFASEQDWINSGVQVCNSLKNESNVLFSPWGEPNFYPNNIASQAAGDGNKSTQQFEQDYINQARGNGTQNIFVCQTSSDIDNLNSLADCFTRSPAPITGDNIIYAFHMYDDDISTPYQNTFSGLVSDLTFDKLIGNNSFSSIYPTQIDELGGYRWSTIGDAFLNQAEQIFNNNSIGWCTWVFRGSGTAYALYNVGYPTFNPTDCGQVMMNNLQSMLVSPSSSSISTPIAAPTFIPTPIGAPSRMPTQ